MNIVNFQGRLGNQMFQYAYAKSIGASVCANGNNQLRNTFTLGSVNFVDRTNTSHSWCSENPYAFPPNSAIERGSLSMTGYFQSDVYMKNIETSLLNEFTFKVKYDTSVIDKDSCAIHVRLGDYKNLTKLYVQVGKAYYAHAIDAIKSSHPHVKFHVFTDEPDLIYKSIDLSNIDYQLHVGNSAEVDMQLSIACRHHITTNSTFAWWCAKLADLRQDANNEIRGMRILPKQWFVNGYPSEGFACDHWIPL